MPADQAEGSFMDRWEGRVTVRDCPFCAERVKQNAKVCKHCGRDLPPPA
jgi:hypothetical protein